MLSRFLLHIVFLSCPLSLLSQQTNIHFEKFTRTNGLSDNSTSSIIQDSRGFLWIGGSNGVNRYDGRFFKKYSLLGNNGLTDLSVMCLAEDADGNIWMGTQNGLNRLNPFTENITRYYEGKGPGTIPYKWCNYLYVDKQKKLWLTTEKGIALYDKSSNSFQNYPVSVYGKDETINKFISKILEDSQGRFWLATSFGVKLFDRTKKTYQSYYYKEGTGKELQSYPIMSLAEDKAGAIWAGTWGGGLLKYNESKNEFEKQIANGGDFRDYIISDISSIVIQNTSYLLMGTNSGVLLYDNDSTRKINFTSLNDNVSRFLNDRQGNLWVASASGLYKMNTASLAFRWITVPGNEKEPDMVFHIIPSFKNPWSYFYLSTLHGWWMYDATTQSVSRYILPADPHRLLSGINKWLPDDKGYWFTSVHGLGYYNTSANQLTDLSSLTGNILGTGIIEQDNKGRLWITLRRNGILVYDIKTKKSVQLFADKTNPDNTTGSDINDMKFSADGFIWFTSGKKLYQVNTENFSYSIFMPPADENKTDEAKLSPDKIFFTPGHRLFISSSLQLYELVKDTLVKAYPKKGYSSFTFEKISCTGSGFVWAITSKGIYKTDTSFSSWSNMSERLGWEEDEAVNELYESKPGEILFAAKGKIGLLKDVVSAKKINMPAPVISRVKQGKKETFLVSLQHIKLKGTYKEPVEIELSPVNFINENENKILYQLQGWDMEWKELQGQSFVRYEQLPPGSYTFITRQINTEGAESPPVSITFRVSPPFYRTWWFISLALLIICIILYAIYRYRLQKAIEMEKLRTRIATDLHDDIGATLSSISMYSQVVKNQLKEKNPQLENVLDKMGENSRDMVNSMSDIVWTINPDNDDGVKLLGRMENYATDICAAKNIRLFFDKDEKLKTTILPLEHRKNIYLIFKEAVNNAVKYSNAQNIWVHLTIRNKKFSMTIKDDGKGFDERTIKKGNGLKNLQMRAEEIKGAVTIDSSAEKGTSVSLVCTI